MSFTPENIFIGAIFVWLIALTVLFVRFYLYYSRLVSYGKKVSFPKLFDEILKKEQVHDKEIENIYKRCLALERDGAFHIQKVGLVRFNPFNDTGGDQSFILALVDATDTGVVISSLHTRAGTRWYAKKVARGKGMEHELSLEEEKALKGAKVFS